MKLAEQFVKLVFDLPQVQRVMLEASDDGVTIWTVIDAKPKDRAFRYPVYERQATVLATVNYMTDDVPDFRLINVREYRDGAQGVLPDAVKVWERERAVRRVCPPKLGKTSKICVPRTLSLSGGTSGAC